MALWPAAVEPWLPAQWRRNQQIPTLDSNCSALPALAISDLKISGLLNGSLLKSPMGKTLPTINLKTSGAVGEVIWYINGEMQYKTGPNQVVAHPIEQVGNNIIRAIDSYGGSDSINLTVILDG